MQGPLIVVARLNHVRNIASIKHPWSGNQWCSTLAFWGNLPPDRVLDLEAGPQTCANIIRRNVN